MAISDASGQVVWRGDYKPFGEEASVSGALANERKFVGKEKDEETGLYYFGARCLDAKIGRFAAVDPVRAVGPRTGKMNDALILSTQGLNAYVYTINNPYKYADAEGRAVYLVARGLETMGGWGGVHTYLILKPDNPSEFNGIKGWTIGGCEDNGRLSAEINNPVDTNPSEFHYPKALQKISAPNGVSDTDFINNIMKSFVKYKSGSRKYRPFPKVDQNQGNCNNITSGALVGAGVSPDALKRINVIGLKPGLGKPLSEMVK
jgi:RHS repeat-associated protein